MEKTSTTVDLETMLKVKTETTKPNTTSPITINEEQKRSNGSNTTNQNSPKKAKSLEKSSL